MCENEPVGAGVLSVASVYKDALGRVGGGHADVGYDDVGEGLVDERQQPVEVAGRADDLDVRSLRKQADDALAKERVVLGDHHPESQAGNGTGNATRSGRQHQPAIGAHADRSSSGASPCTLARG